MDRASHSGLFSNLILKLNTKLGGMNHRVSGPDAVRNVVDEYTMFMGADVTHPALSDSVKSSIAAVTASVDADQYFYEAQLRVQLSHKETITDMKDMCIELLTKFHARRKRLPSKIFFYRDGVSEGQYEQVIREEVSSIRSACELMSRQTKCNPIPKLTVIIVRKRHHTRFTPVDKEDGSGKNINVPAGTAVDTDVVSPHDFDFYLCSHEASVGTARPTHYVVLIDENHLSSDEITRITFNLCHMYPPTAKSISIPTPVQYAHRAAKRARSHAIADGAANRIPKRKVHPNQVDEVARKLNDSIRIHKRLTEGSGQNPNMYFI